MSKNQLSCLHQFENCSEFFGYIEDELRIENWLIWNASLSARADYLDEGKNTYEESHLAFQKLRDCAFENDIHAEHSEVVTWIDTLRIMFDALVEADLPEEVLGKLKIIQEYKIPFTKKRADYLLVYQNKILILEFSIDDNDDSDKYGIKLQQVLGYKERLSVLCPNNIEIGTYVYIIKHESINPYSKFTPVDKPTLANYKSTCTLAQYIRIFFSKEVVGNALMQLYCLDVDEKSTFKNKK